ncbi:MAG: GNAT family N-acetyltransferase [Acidobacteria bacterium]|nr:GNAT family N-acetyltransferase [Acidobacteriota bacterium]
MTAQIRSAESDEEIRNCFNVMAELRPHLTEEEFLRRVKRQKSDDKYTLAFLEDESEVKAVAGFRVSECLAWGKFLYVDDLVTKSDERSKGYGQALFDWIVAYARESRCNELQLDSAVHRFGAHRFYLLNRMDITCHHFGLKLKN